MNNLNSVAQEKIGISSTGNMLVSSPKIDSPERVFQLEVIVYNHEAFKIMGISEDDEKITIFAQSGETRNKRAQFFTFDVKRSKSVRDGGFTITNKSLYDLKTLGTAIGIFGSYLPYTERQSALEVISRPKDTAEIMESFLLDLYESRKVQVTKLGASMPLYSLWKLDYIEKEGLENIGLALCESKTITESDKEIVRRELELV